MTTALLGLGSNLGDREVTLNSALDEIGALPNVRVSRRSDWHRSRPLGGPPGQAEYVNAAAVVDTTVPPLAFLELLQRIEARHGRVPAERWAARPLDIDLLLYGDEVVEMPQLTVPHLRMTFRRFVLEPAAEVAPRMAHPIIGWPIERLLLHLNSAKDEVVMLSPSEALRSELTARLSQRFGARAIDAPIFKTAEQLWPANYATWLSVSHRNDATPANVPSAGGLRYAASQFPKLTILLDADGDAPRAVKADWSAIVRQPGRGPMLRLQLSDRAAIEAEVFAAIESVWPI
ncbi:MAG TPA: 2-amino-4-hydroxy-6-hydroxymethyldihydropteridine diphosphokinase [Lacipirellulaceae bacterium]|nr:2-amino-4-hydroxy-6-hydroxymethyldihydropteridine diphosphokinase [Lacipirellulaceae bacterium]